MTFSTKEEEEMSPCIRVLFSNILRQFFFFFRSFFEIKQKQTKKKVYKKFLKKSTKKKNIKKIIDIIKTI